MTRIDYNYGTWNKKPALRACKQCRIEKPVSAFAGKNKTCKECRPNLRKLTPQAEKFFSRIA